MWLDLLLLVALLGALLYAAGPAVPAGRRDALRRRATDAGERVSRRVASSYRALARQAGFEATREGDYWLIKLAAAVLPPLLLLDAGAGAWALVAGLAGFFVPDLWLLGRRRQRRRLITRALPYFLDLVVAFLHSGLSLVDAFRRAGREAFSGPHPLAREVELVGQELDAGRDPSLAFHDLAERTGVADLRAVAAALRVGMRLGASIRETLLAQADALLVKRREDALKRIHRAELQMMFPVMLSGFPVFIVLAFFPMIMDLVDVYYQAAGLIRR